MPRGSHATGRPSGSTTVVLVTLAVALILAACSSTSPRATATTHPPTHPARTTSTSATTTTTVAPPTTTTPAPTTTAAPPTTRVAPPTTARPAAVPVTTVSSAPHPEPGGPSTSCAFYGAGQIQPGQAVSFDIQLSEPWTSGPTETASDEAPVAPPVRLHLVGTRGTAFFVAIYWDPTKPYLAGPVQAPGAWICQAGLGA